LDKDILVKGNKIYSPETCAFVPTVINNLFTSRVSKRGKYPIGVSVSGSRYRVTMTKDNKQYFFGAYGTPEEGFQAYKNAKETYIKEVAELWKDKIGMRVYEALINYTVEITD